MRLAPLNFWSNRYSSGSRGNRVNIPPTQIFRAERMRIDSRQNCNFSLIFFKFLLKFSLNLSKFSLKLLKFSIKFPKFVQTLTNFVQITIINLIYNTVYLNCYKLLQTLINFIKCFRNCFNYF